MEKKDLRAFIRAKKRAMTSAQVEAASARLAEKLFQHPAYQAAYEFQVPIFLGGGYI